MLLGRSFRVDQPDEPGLDLRREGLLAEKVWFVSRRDLETTDTLEALAKSGRRITLASQRGNIDARMGLISGASANYPN